MGSPFSGERPEFELEARPTRNSPYNTGNSPYNTGNSPYNTGNSPYTTGNSPYNTGNSTHNTRNSVHSTGNSTQSTGTIERNIASLHISQYPLSQTHQERRAPHNQNSNYNASNSTRRLSNSLPSEHSIPTVVRELEKISINEREYTIFKEIGKGSSGKVYQVISHTKGEIYALKVIEIKNPEDRKNTLNEIELLESLNKEKNIISLIDHYTTASMIYMIMEYGEIDLATLIRNHSTDEWDINFITYYWGQMLHAVRAIHTKNIVHSDLKPANFVLSKGRLKLIDFGIAKKHSDDTANIHRDIQVGTINYMSPEALSGINEDINETGKNVISLGAPSDVWSLGCILYQMVYGKTPFYHMTITQKVANIPNPSYQIRFPKQVVFGADNVIMNIPKSLINVMSRCLDRRPDMRPSMFELQKNLLVNDTFN
ncbi:unnamed protein product [Rhizopus stolonifer]